MGEKNREDSTVSCFILKYEEQLIQKPLSETPLAVTSDIFSGETGNLHKLVIIEADCYPLMFVAPSKIYSALPLTHSSRAADVHD